MLKRLLVGEEKGIMKKVKDLSDYLSIYWSHLHRVAESIHNIPTTSNQIDYLVYIKPHRFYHPFLAWIGLHFLVECKNENSSISSREVADLSILMDDYKCKL